MREPFEVWAPGRPAPQGSKKRGQHGQLIEASAYLPAWRAAVKTAVYQEYKRRGIKPGIGELPLFRGPVAFGPCTFWLLPEQLPQARIDGKPDLDKLMRAVWDALTAARLWGDDGQVVMVRGPIEKRCTVGPLQASVILPGVRFAVSSDLST